METPVQNTEAGELNRSRAEALFILHCRSRRLPPRTLEWYEATFSDFRGTVGIVAADASIHDVRRYLVAVTDRASSATAAVRHRALKSFFCFHAADGLRPDNPMERIPRPRVPQKVVAAIDAGIVKALLHTCNQALDTGAILLKWSPSSSLAMESGQYRLLWDGGSGLAPSTLLETQAHVAGKTQYSYLSPVLSAGVTYTFKLVAVSGAGVADSGLTIVKATARLADNGAPELRFITPRSDKPNVNKTGVVRVEVGPLDAADPALANLGKVRFQYRSSVATIFSDFVLANPDVEANPENYGGSGNVGINWAASSLADGEYELRAIPILSTGAQVEANAVYAHVKLTSNASEANDSTAFDAESGKVSHEETLYGNSDTVTTSLPTKEKVNVVLDSSASPLNSSGQAPKGCVRSS